jgi:hypothetical protein
VHKVVQGALHVHHVQGQAHVEVQEGHEAQQNDQHEQEVVVHALKLQEIV